MINLFFSYSHEDEILRNELAKHLSLLVTQGTIKAWHDGKISAGTEWDAEIKKNLNAADIILLLVSADFLASDYIGKVELEQAMERHEAGEARVIPVILRPVDDWESASFGKLQALPEGGKAVTTWSDHDEAFADIVRGIRKVIEEIGTQKAGEESQLGGNYVLLSLDTDFHKILWDELKNCQEDLNIDITNSINYEFSKEEEKKQGGGVEKYRNYLKKFTEDSEAKWLFTIWPEDRLSKWSPETYQNILTPLVSKTKYIICFESGMKWNEKQEKLKQKQFFIFKTKYQEAVKNLLNYTAHQVYDNSFKNINITAILGPSDSPSARERREIYNEFLAQLYYMAGLYRDRADNYQPLINPSNNNRDFWTNLMRDYFRKIDNIQTNYLEIEQWLFDEKVKSVVSSICPSLKEIVGSRSDTCFCFFCGNDDIALGTRDIVKEYLGKEYENNRFLYIGFDGSEKMKNALRNQEIVGATMEVNWFEMCERAKNMVELHSDMDQVIHSFSATLISNPEYQL